MSDRSERGSGVSDRLSRRFESDEQAEDSEQSESSGSSQRSKPSQGAQGAQDAQPAKGSQESEDSESSSGELNVKEEWTGRYMYLPDGIDSAFDSEYDRLVYECGREFDWKPKKNKHYYPIAVKHGVDAIVEMDADEFVGAVDEMELR